MSKEDNNAQSLKKVIVSVTVFILLMTIIVYFIVENDCVSKASNDVWLSYFGGLVSGMATLIAIFISVYYSKKESEKHFKFMERQAMQSTLKIEYVNLYNEVLKLENYIGSFGTPLSDFDTRYCWRDMKDFSPLESIEQLSNYYKNNLIFFKKDLHLEKLISEIEQEMNFASSVVLSTLEMLEVKVDFVEKKLDLWMNLIEQLKEYITSVVLENKYPN